MKTTGIIIAALLILSFAPVVGMATADSPLVVRSVKVCDGEDKCNTVYHDDGGTRDICVGICQ